MNVDTTFTPTGKSHTMMTDIKNQSSVYEMQKNVWGLSVEMVPQPFLTQYPLFSLSLS
jgi:hypothetical protein